MFLSPSTRPHPGEFDVGGVDDAPRLVGIGDDPEEETTAFLVYGQVAELVDDQQARLADDDELPAEPVLLLGAARAHEQAGRGEETDGHAPFAGEPADGYGEVALAGADGPVGTRSSHRSMKSRLSSWMRPQSAGIFRLVQS